MYSYPPLNTHLIQHHHRTQTQNHHNVIRETTTNTNNFYTRPTAMFLFTQSTPTDTNTHTQYLTYEGAQQSIAGKTVCECMCICHVGRVVFGGDGGGRDVLYVYISAACRGV